MLNAALSGRRGAGGGPRGMQLEACPLKGLVRRCHIRLVDDFNRILRMQTKAHPLHFLH
jgi:hypothetical protein